MRIGVSIVLLLLVGIASATAATETQISQTMVDPSPYRLFTAVASSGNGYLVAWGAGVAPNIDVQGGRPMTIYLRAIGADGTPIQPLPVAVGTGQKPSIAWNGHEYLVVWGITDPTSGPLSTPSVAAIRVREDGSLIDSAPVTLISEVNPFSDQSTVVWSGTQYLVTWTRGMALVDLALNARRISLTPLGGEPFYSGTSGGDFIVLPIVFVGFRQNILIQPVSATGETKTPTILNGPHAGIAGVDDGYAMIWDDTTALYTSHLSADGVMSPSSPLFTGRVRLLSLKARDGRIAASWQTSPDATHISVCTARIDTATKPICSSGVQHDASLDISSTSILLAWSDQKADGDVVRINVTPSTDMPHADSTLGRSISDLPPAVPAADRRSDGSVIVAWTEYSQTSKHFEVHLGGLSSKGVRLTDRVVFPTSLDQGPPIVSAGFGRTIILWNEGTVESKIRLVIVDDVSGAVIATLLLGTGVTPTVAFDGVEWMVAWQTSAAPSVVRFAMLNSDGVVLAPGSVPATSTTSPSQAAPAITWSGKTFFLAWRESALAGQPATDRIEVSAVSLAGVASAPVTLDFADAGLGMPSLAANGNRLLVSWGRPVNTLRQAVFDSTGKQLGKFIDFAWPYAFGRTRTHAITGGFATLAGSRVALTSADGVALDTIDIQPAAGTGDFVADPSNRLTFIYSRLVGNTSAATFAQTMGLPRRRPQNR